jgi:GrpB-like predicted nucleotidyltransferase (UPF0157 family)
MNRGLGLESGTVRVVPYDATWPLLFDAEVSRLVPIAASYGVTIVFEHTGSTAVPALAAKPILDILAGRRDSDAARACAVEALEAAGYVYRGEQGIPGRDFFRRGDPRQYHVHLTSVGSAFWREHQAFRDYLRSHPEAALEYAALKYALARRFPNDREAYIEGKTAFVRSILAVATPTRASSELPPEQLTTMRGAP